MGKENFHNLNERLLHKRKLKSGYLEGRIYERALHLRVNLLSRIKANIFQNYMSLVKRKFLRRLKNKSSMLKKFLFKRISSILIPKSSAKNTRKTNSKRRNRIIFSPPDKILQRSERKRKVVHQKDDKNKAIILR